ncbi:microfibrillar-associated protein 2 isoform X2 [Denticeps clupeoides]|uniref:microfibrillar-associated protein 2 isoform X2 n=1 Tax=Denticeps clupeoides TaxID=299321 RepID=UPI0010A439F0|nr:microfibrillar-associated protein 2 isoform X2 [Denticeps clupeoides]
MRVSCLLLLTLPVLIIAQQYPQQFFPVQEEYDYDITDVELQDKNLRKLTTGPGEFEEFKTEPTEPGPLDCREEQYPCTRLYSVHQPCKQCLNSLCFYSLRRVYVINKEVCVRTVCAHEELLRGKFSLLYLWSTDHQNQCQKQTNNSHQQSIPTVISG